MGFPKNSRQFQTMGRVGTKASENPVIYAAGQTVAGDNGVEAGLFAWGKYPTETTGVYNPVKYSNAGTGKPGGIISGETVQTYLNINEESTMKFAKGNDVLVMVQGDIFVKSETVATAGQKVFANLVDGKIKTGVAGATIEGAIETDFKVLTTGEVGDIIIISNY